VLRALKHQLRPGGQTAFLTIHVAPGLSAAARRRAAREGPRAVAARSDHLNMLRNAGYVDAVEIDATATFLHTARAWLQESERLGDELAPLEPHGAFAERQAERSRMIAAMEDGLLLRSLYSARRR
jgi:hypothetical protein